MRQRVLLLALCLGLGALAPQASSPTFWQVSTQADFLRGEVENLSIDSDGRVLLGPLNTVLHEPAAPFLWTAVVTPEGTLYAGSGNEGKVFRVSTDGAASTFFDADELEVHALALASDGTLYVGTSPEGRVYRVAPDGTASTFFEPEQRYIWALAFHPDGSLYVATGDQGVIYRVDPDGTGRELYRSRATHVLALAFDGEGRLLAGTESPGQVLRIEREGRAFALLDSGFREIRALRVDASGVIYAAALSGRPPSPEPRPAETPQPETPRAPVPTITTEISGIAVADVGGAAPPARQPERTQARGAVFRIMPDGIWDLIWESSEDSPYDVAIDTDGGLLIGTGNSGKVFRLAGEPRRVSLLARASAQQITQFVSVPGGRRYYTTANPGKIFQLSADRATSGSYVSEVRDAGTVATWGTVRWRAVTDGDARVELFTRSGNTGVPDDTWSDWSDAYTRADGQQIASPAARYLQWRASLSASRGNALLTSVTAAYLQRNLPPRVASITVHPAGVVFQRPFTTTEFEVAGYEELSPDGRPGAAPPGLVPPPQGTTPLGRRSYQKSLQTFTWRAEDTNDDRLVFDVYYRRELEDEWRLLRRNLSEPVLAWDTTSVPDGTYVIRVVASDAPSNAPETALTGHLDSTAFDIDNTPPRIDVSAARRDGDRQIVRFVVRDDQSPVRRVEYSLDGDGWNAIYPVDGIPDSLIEEFELVLDADQSPGSVIIRATDAMNNSVTALAVPD